MYKIIAQNGQVAYGITEYVADSFDELPNDVNFGDKAIFLEDGKLKIALYLTTGWVRSE